MWSFCFCLGVRNHSHTTDVFPEGKHSNAAGNLEAVRDWLAKVNDIDRDPNGSPSRCESSWLARVRVQLVSPFLTFYEESENRNGTEYIVNCTGYSVPQRALFVIPL